MRTFSLTLVATCLVASCAPLGEGKDSTTYASVGPASRLVAASRVIQRRQFFVMEVVVAREQCDGSPRRCHRTPVPNLRVDVAPVLRTSPPILIGQTDNRGLVETVIDPERVDAGARYRIFVDGINLGAADGLEVLGQGRSVDGPAPDEPAESTVVTAPSPADSTPPADTLDPFAEEDAIGPLAAIGHAAHMIFVGGRGRLEQALPTMALVYTPGAENPRSRLRVKVEFEAGKARVMYLATGWEDSHHFGWESFTNKLAQSVYAVMTSATEVEELIVDVMLRTQNGYGEEQGPGVWIRLQCSRAIFERIRRTFFASGRIRPLSGDEIRVLELLMVKNTRPPGAVQDSLVGY